MQSGARVLRIAMAMAVATALAACTGGHHAPDDENSASVDRVDRVGQDPERQAPAPAVPDASTGGVVTASGFDFPSLDPGGLYDLTVNPITSALLFRSLTQYVWDPEANGMVLIPDLATDLGRPNDDYTEWIFTIRDGVRFEDGTPVTADDVAYGIKRSMDEVEFPDGPRYGNQFFLHGDSYGGAYTGGTAYDGLVVDGDQLTIKMSRPFPDMPYYGAFPEMGPVLEAGSDPSTYGSHPLATGPYKIAPNDAPGKGLTLIRNEQWDPDTDPGRHQYVDGFDFQPGGHTEAVWRSLLADRGRAQTTFTSEDIPVDLVDQVEHRAKGRLLTATLPCLLAAWPDYRRIKDLKVRRALGYAFPPFDQWSAALRSIGGITAFPASSILPPGTPGRVDYDPLAVAPGESDPAMALTLLRQAAHDPGEYRIDYPFDESDPTSEARNRLLTSALEEAGFNAVGQGVPGSRYESVRRDPSGPWNLRLHGWCADWRSGSSWFQPLFGTHGFPGWFAETDVDEEIDRIERLPLSEQDAAWGELDRMIEDRYYPVIPVAYGGTAQLHGSRLGGLHLDDFGVPTLQDVYVMPRA